MCDGKSTKKKKIKRLLLESVVSQCLNTEKPIKHHSSKQQANLQIQKLVESSFLKKDIITVHSYININAFYFTKKKLMSAALLARIQNLIAQGENKMSQEYGVEKSLFYHYFKVLSLESNSTGQGFYHFCSFPYPQNLSTMPGT